MPEPNEGVTDPEPEPEPAGLVREHPPHVREILRRAGLSMCAGAGRRPSSSGPKVAQTIGDGGFDDETPAAKIRHYIIPPAEGEGVTE